MIESYNAESAIIGGLMLFPEECNRALEELLPSDFANPYASKAFEMILSANKGGKKFDAAIFGSSNADPEVKKFAITSAEAFISTGNYDGYIETVKNASGKHRVSIQLQEMIYSGDPYEKIVADLEKIVLKEKETEKPKEIGDFLTDYILSLDEKVDPLSRISTGFSRLDRILHGIRKGSLCYIGAFPSTGKTSFAINISRQNIHEKKRVQIFSLEMSKQQILDRMYSDIFSIDYDRIDTRELIEDEKAKIVSATGKLFRNKSLEIIDDVYSIEAIGSRISKFKPDLVIVDFIQNVRTSGYFQKRKDQVDFISSELKRFARVNNCAVIALSQLARTNEEPKMSDLKESGNLEADGDYIMLMYRPYVTDKKNFDPKETHILLDKNKYGECGIDDMCFDGNHQRFTEEEKRYDGDENG